MKHLLLTLTALAAIACPAFAHQPVIQRINTPLDRVMDINLHPGVGSNINFEGVGEQIEFISLQNKSFVGLTTNACPTGNNCSTLGSLVNIALIDRLNLPGVIEVNKQAKQSLLTIVTKDRSGKRKTYIFNLRRAKNSDPAVALVDFTLPPSPPPPAPIAPEISFYPQLMERMSEDRQARKELVDRLFKGLRIANKQGELNNYSPVQFQAIKNMILAVREGQELPEAAAKYEVDLNLISRLILLSHEKAN